MRAEVGVDFPILVKMNVDDGFPGGMTEKDAMVCAETFARAGADALVCLVGQDVKPCEPHSVKTHHSYKFGQILTGGNVTRAGFYMLRGDVPLKVIPLFLYVHVCLEPGDCSVFT